MDGKSLKRSKPRSLECTDCRSYWCWKLGAKSDAKRAESDNKKAKKDLDSDRNKKDAWLTEDCQFFVDALQRLASSFVEGVCNVFV